jgi:hypothetical protein
VAIPAGFAGAGRLTFRATSPTGYDVADWAYLRRITLGHTPREKP